MPSSRVSRSWQGMLPTMATVGLVILVMGCLYWAKPVLIPVAFAVLLSFVLNPVITGLQRRGLPRIPAVIAVVLIFVLISLDAPLVLFLIFLAYAVSGPLFASLRLYQRRGSKSRTQDSRRL